MMFMDLKAALSRSRERERHRRDYETVLGFDQRMLRDIGLRREDAEDRLARLEDRA